MRTAVRFAAAAIVASSIMLAGCAGDESPKPVTEPKNKSPVTVSLVGTDRFPEFLVGTWRAPRESGSEWEFVFQPDGKLSSVVMDLGRVRIQPGRTLTLPTISGGKSEFIPGQWTVHYLAPSRILTVRIVLDSFRVEMGEDVLEGKETDVFVGEVAENGKAWQVEWTSFPKYIAETGGTATELPVDQQYGVTKELILEKVEK